jgi:hypothetical protein
MLVLSIILLVTPFLFNSFAVFPMFSLQYSVMILGSFVLFAISINLLVFVSGLPKAERTLRYSFAVAGSLSVPLLFAVFGVTPFLASAVAWMYVLMHFVFAAGAVMLYTQRSQIKKLF